jgi:hypothetical protein
MQEVLITIGKEAAGAYPVQMFSAEVITGETQLSDADVPGLTDGEALYSLLASALGDPFKKIHDTSPGSVSLWIADPLLKKLPWDKLTAITGFGAASANPVAAIEGERGPLQMLAWNAAPAPRSVAIELLAGCDGGQRIRCAIAGEPAVGNMKFADGELEELQGLLSGTTPAAELEAHGLQLYGHLKPALGAPLQQILDGPACAIFLDIADNALLRVPWEILVWPKTVPFGQVNAWVAFTHHLSRMFNPNWQAQGPGEEGPLRTLIVIGENEDDAIVLAGNEQQEIRRRVAPTNRTIQIAKSDRPVNLQALYGDIRDLYGGCHPHILHFIGHGRNQPPRLEFPSWDWSAGQIAADVGGFTLEEWRPRIAFLNACRTGEAAEAMAPVAGAFLGSGTMAVVAMQGDITGEAAGVLAGVFYEHLARGVPIHEAMSRARAEVYALRTDRRQACLATLTLRCSPSAVLPRFHPLAEDYRARIRRCEMLPKLCAFVDQVRPRRELCTSLWPVTRAARRCPFIVLRGEEGFGKTILSAWLLDLTVHLGHIVRYVKVDQAKGGVDYVKVLELIWGSSGPGSGSPLLDGLPSPNLPKHYDLQELLRSSKDPAVYGTFVQALNSITKEQERKLTLVLDDLNSKEIDPDSF